MEKTLAQLIEISNTVGRDKTLVVGTGGNTSVKTDDGRYMYIKASGTALKDMNGRLGWRRLKTESVYEIFEDKSLAKMGITKREFEIVNRLQATCDDDIKSGARPSVESLLHVVLDKYIIHLHALPVLVYACAKNGEKQFLKLFRNERFQPLWIPYADPGFSLSKKVFRMVNSYFKQYGTRPAIMVLEKHGLLVADNTEDGVIKLVHKVIKYCNRGLEKTELSEAYPLGTNEIDSIRKAIKKALLKAAGQNTPVNYFTNQTVASFAARKDAKKLLAIPALTPDEMGFVSSPIIWLEKYDYKTIADKIKAGTAKGQKPPTVFFVKDAGLFIVADKKILPVLTEVIAGSLFVRSNARNLGGINPLNRRQRDFINNWEGEKFRVRLASGRK